jgi:hypothetical protein
MNHVDYLAHDATELAARVTAGDVAPRQTARPGTRAARTRARPRKRRRTADGSASAGPGS